MTNKERLLNLLLDILKIDGVSKEERHIADFIIHYFHNLGLPIVEDSTGEKIGGNAGNLYLKVPGQLDLDPVLLVVHMDTINSTKDLKCEVTGNEIRSDGETILGADNRAGVALVCELIKRLLVEGRVYRPLEILFTVAEEEGLLGVRNLDFSKIKSKAAFVLDICDRVGSIVVRAPSVERITVHVKGRPAHAGVEPENGVNAIAIAASAISKIQQGRIDSDTTLNIGKITGGKAINIVPEDVSIKGEIRSFNKKALNELKDNVTVQFEKAAKDYGGDVSIDYKTSYNTFTLDKDVFPAWLAKKAAEELNIDYNITQSGGGSDANVLNEYEIVSVGLGIGAFAAHTNDEYIVLSDFYKGIDWLEKIITLDF